MLYRTKPEEFTPRFEVVGCFVEHENRILLLKRGSNRPEPGTWGMPAGKIEKNETPAKAMSRELSEETGLTATDPTSIKYFGQFYVKYPTYDFVYHIFHWSLAEAAKITIDKEEHSDSLWVEPKQALKLQLIGDLDECLKIFYGL